jgi:hypothetical protein
MHFEGLTSLGPRYRNSAPGEGCISRHAALAFADLAEMRVGNMQGQGYRTHADAHRLDVVLHQYLARSQQRFSSAGFETLVLPSSSPAYAHMSFEDKLAVWKKIVDPK